MFTGIVEERGTLATVEGSRMRLSCADVLADVTLGASIAVNGCCLTVVAFEVPSGGSPGWWEADLSEETLGRTSLGSLRPGDPVNLERPVRLSDRLGGHLVQGHVDAVGTIVATPPGLVVSAPPTVLRYLVPKGSIAVDGVSLTVVDVFDDRFSVAVIPHTAQVTTLGHTPPGASVNLEVDVLAKYTERLLGPYALPGASPVAPSTDDPG